MLHFNLLPVRLKSELIPPIILSPVSLSPCLSSSVPFKAEHWIPAFFCLCVWEQRRKTVSAGEKLWRGAVLGHGCLLGRRKGFRQRGKSRLDGEAERRSKGGKRSSFLCKVGPYGQTNSSESSQTEDRHYWWPGTAEHRVPLSAVQLHKCLLRRERKWFIIRSNLSKHLISGACQHYYPLYLKLVIRTHSLTCAVWGELCYYYQVAGLTLFEVHYKMGKQNPLDIKGGR